MNQIESIVDVKGKVKTVPQPVESCTQRNIELDVEEFWVVSLSAAILPLQLEDAARSESEIKQEESLSIRVKQDTRLGE